MKVEMEMTGTYYHTEGRMTTPYREGKRYTVEKHVYEAAKAAGKAERRHGRGRASARKPNHTKAETGFAASYGSDEHGPALPLTPAGSDPASTEGE